MLSTHAPALAKRSRETPLVVTRNITPKRYVYVIGAINRPVKIGVTGNITVRLVHLRHGSPERLNVWHIEDAGNIARAVERTSHYLLRDHRLSGEWFDIPPLDAVATIKNVRRAIESGDISSKRYYYRDPRNHRGPDPLVALGISGRLTPEQLKIARAYRRAADRIGTMAKRGAGGNVWRREDSLACSEQVRRADGVIMDIYGPEILEIAKSILCEGRSMAVLGRAPDISALAETLGPLLGLMAPIFSDVD